MGMDPAACLEALGGFGIVLLAQLLKGVPALWESGSAEMGNDADDVGGSVDTAMFYYGGIKMEEAPGIFK